LHPFHDDTNAEICSELSLKVLYLLSYPLVNILFRPQLSLRVFPADATVLVMKSCGTRGRGFFARNFGISKFPDEYSVASA
jgi:hypothetical protein